MEEPYTLPTDYPENSAKSILTSGRSMRAGRYGSGVRPEDIQFLVTYYHTTYTRDCTVTIAGERYAILSFNALSKLLQLAGVPMGKGASVDNLPSAMNHNFAEKINNMLNSAQDTWKITFRVRPDSFGVRLPGFRVVNTQRMGGNTLADVLDI